MLAVLYSALIFGTMLAPYLYIACGALSYFAPTAVFIIIPWLVTCTALLLLTFISRTKAEEKLATQFGRYWRPIAAIAVTAAMCSTYFLESKIANFTLLTPVKYWYYLILFSGAATAVALVVITATRASRLENALASLFSPENWFGIFRRVLGYVVLVAVLIVAGSKLYEYYLYSRQPAY